MGDDSDRDDYELPPVDVEIPDDARELERDLQAYRREQRQYHRRERLQRLVRPLGRYGPIPLFVAGVVVAVAIAATMMTVFGPQPTDHASRSPLATKPMAATGKVGGPLPSATLRLAAGKRRLKDLRPALLLVVPRHCRCDKAVDQLTDQARGVSISVYLIGSKRSAEQLNKLASTAGHGAAIAADDPKAVLASTYHASGLTAILVHTDGVLGGVLRGVKPKSGPWLEHDLYRLQHPGSSKPALPHAT